MELLERLKILNNHLVTKNYTKVIEGCKKILKNNPNIPYALNLCGLALQGNKDILASITYFQKAIDIEPNNVAAINNLANSFKAMTRLDAAEELYLKALKINPNYVHALNNYGNLKQQLGDHKASVSLYLKALNFNPNQINILLSLASVYQESGNFEKSKDVAKKIIKIDSKNTSSHKLISGMLNYKEDKEHLKEMEELFEEKNLNNEQLTDLSFALGKAYEDLEDYDKSFKFLEKGNKLKKKKTTYQINKDTKLFNSIIKTFQDLDLNDFKKVSNNHKIIFICGMPRSGTTLIEQIIASHKDVNGGGELVYLQNAINQNFIENFKLDKQRIIEQATSENDVIEKLYFNLLKHHNFSLPAVTDKAPQNFRWIGFMKIFFPTCKVIHCNRNSKDNCLSLYKNNFASKDMDWTYDQKDIADYYNLYSDLMNFWNEKIPDFIYDANYEKIVKDKEVEIKKLIDFCDLKWDPACLNHHKNNKTKISTVSVVQARKPIYNSSLNSNLKFSKNLKTLFDNLKS
ncbi:MAG: hypothetical protein CMI80_00375 [Candidatus Pelagibacter sp.]|nr:hypothetical protein [Candidatus Pelagibacter sp.]|tara:strand:- start:590 stop:2140 length:1551 start_codon:yes stop_codon:yes gene_type:complete